MSGPAREAGWGLHEKNQRARQAEQARQVIKPGANDAFVFKRPKPQQQYQQHTAPAPPPAVPVSLAITPSAPQAPPAAPVAPPTPPPQQQQQQQLAATDDDYDYEDDGMSGANYPSVSPAHARESIAPSGVTPTSAAAAPPAAAPAAAAAPATTPVSGGGGGAAGGLSSPSSSSRVSQQSNLLCSCLVELFEMCGQNPVPKAYGPKGVTLLRMPNSAAAAEGSNAVPFLFQLLVYAPVSKKAEFSVDVFPGFSFTLLPDRFATFEDAASKRSWCLKFGASEDAFAFARSFALIAEMRAATAYAAARAAGAQVPPRGLLCQDLAVGAPDSPACAIGDQVKCRWTVWILEISNMFAGDAARTKLFSTGKETRKLMLGEGSLISTAVEEALVGMRKKGTRLLVVPPNLAQPINERADWGPHVKPDCTLLIEVNVTGVRNSLPTNPAEEAAAGGRDSPNAEAVAAGDDEDSTGGAGGYNPTTAAAGATDLRSRMAALSSVAHNTSNGMSAASPSTPSAAALAPTMAGPAVVARRDSLTPVVARESRASSPSRAGSITTAPTTGTDNAAPAASPSSTSSAASTSGVGGCPSLESFLSDLSLGDLLPSFRREGVGFADLLLLEPEDLRTIVPQIGPRRRILGKIAEMQQQQQSSKNTTTTASATPAPSIPAAAASPSSSDSQHRSIPPTHPSTGASAGASTATAATTGPSPHRSRFSSGADHSPLFSPASPTTPSSAVPSVAQRYAAAAAAASGGVSPAPVHPPPSLRSRTFSDNADTLDSHAAAHSASRAVALPTSQAALEALLSAEYERGQADTISLCKTKIAELKETASTRFASLTAQLDEAAQAREADRERAREAVARLREELRATQERLASADADKAAAVDKAARFTEQLKARLAVATAAAAESAAKASSSEAKLSASVASAEGVRGALDRIYTGVRAKFGPKELYEGAEALQIVRQTLKDVSAELEK
jgi:hypothetical protein